MHIACVSYFYEPRLKSPEELLETYQTLPGWAEGLAAAGARVSVVQRFGYDIELMYRDVHYYFVADPTRRMGSALDRARRVNQAVARLNAEVIHVNGLTFARQAWWLKRQRPRTPILLQDHANFPPRGGLSAAMLRFALRRLDAVSFTAPEQALPWQEDGCLQPDTPVFSLMEGSSRFRLQSRARARTLTELHGDPLCLWVGRLNANKDPLTVLEGFACAAPYLPDPRLLLVYGESDLLPEVQHWLAENPHIADRILLIGKRPHEELEALYNSADLFLLGSHHEGSGYAALEALACGVSPVLTDIPSFRMLLSRGEVGTLWSVGSSDSLACALISAHNKRRQETPEQVRAYFDAHWSFEAIGREALEVYRQMRERRRA